MKNKDEAKVEKVEKVEIAEVKAPCKIGSTITAIYAILDKVQEYRDKTQYGTEEHTILMELYGELIPLASDASQAHIDEEQEWSNYIASLYENR